MAKTLVMICNQCGKTFQQLPDGENLELRCEYCRTECKCGAEITSEDRGFCKECI